MKYQEIFESMLRGEIIHWRNRQYTVVFGDPNKKDGELLIRYNSDTPNYVGIAINDNGEMIHYSPDDFYVDSSPENTADIGRMIQRLLKRLRDYKERNNFTYFEDYFVRVEMGKKYFKIFACEKFKNETVNNGIITCFVDKNTGDIYKPATYKAPAKHARGNVNSEKCGMEAFNENGFVRYLK